MQVIEKVPAAPAVDTSMRAWIRTPLGILAVGFVLVMVAVAIVLPVNQVTQSGGTVDMSIGGRATASALDTVPNLPRNAWLEYPQGEDPLMVDLVVWDSTLPVYASIMSEVSDSALALMMAVIVFSLLRLRGQFATGRPFAPGNSKLLVVIAAAIVVGSYGSDLLGTYASQIFYEHLSLQRPLFVDGSLSLVPLVLAGAVLAIAQAFRKGRALTDDVEGLV
jgi:hypothetical protein